MSRLAVSHNFRIHTWEHAFRYLPCGHTFAAAIDAIHQPCEWVRFAPTIGITPYLSSDALYVVKGFLVYDRRMGVLKDQPLVFIDIMALFILEMLACLEIYRMP